VLRGYRVADGVQRWWCPAAAWMKQQAEAEGLDRVFTEAGMEWRYAPCSMAWP
jgi:3-isopropylmalate/(R)-2-methylmalate dehydratase large subunit